MIISGFAGMGKSTFAAIVLRFGEFLSDEVNP